MTTSQNISQTQRDVAAFARAHVPPAQHPVARDTLLPALALGHVSPALAALYSENDGLMLDRLDVFSLQDARQHPAGSALSAAFPGAVLFGWDRSGYLFFEDVKGSMGQGEGAVFAVDKIYVTPGTCILCAPDLAEFLARSIDGRPPWFAPRLIDVQTEALRRALDENSNRVETRPPKSSAEIAAVTGDAGLGIGMGHLAVLRISDGFLFPQSGIEIYGLGDLRALPTRGLCRFGEGAAPRSFAITGTQAARPVDMVLDISVAGDTDAAPSLGRVLDVVTAWALGDTGDAR